MLLGWFVAALCGPGEGGVRWPDARVEVLAGRARLATESGLLDLAPGTALEVRGAAHLELVGPAEIALTWPSRASLSLGGPAVLEWSTDDPASLRLRMIRAASADIELRRGALELELFETWSSLPGPGAYFLASRPPRGIQVVHRAGAEWTLEHVDLDPARSARCTLRAGDECVLAADERIPRDAFVEPERRRAPWTSFDWPWLTFQAPAPEAVRNQAPLRHAAPDGAERVDATAARGEEVPDSAPRWSEPALWIADAWTVAMLQIGLHVGPPEPPPIRREGALGQTPWGARFLD